MKLQLAVRLSGEVGALREGSRASFASVGEGSLSVVGEERHSDDPAGERSC